LQYVTERLRNILPMGSYGLTLDEFCPALRVTISQGGMNGYGLLLSGCVHIPVA
jgi:hypothetical protein